MAHEILYSLLPHKHTYVCQEVTKCNEETHKPNTHTLLGEMLTNYLKLLLNFVCLGTLTEVGKALARGWNI